MRNMVCLVSLCFLMGCAGIKVPFTDYRAGRLMFQSGHDTTNADCIEIGQLKAVSGYLERKHISFLSSQNEEEALNVEEFKASLGSECLPVITSLTTRQIQEELVLGEELEGASDKLLLLGGLLFKYEDITTDSGLRATLHLEQEHTGPHRRIIAIYRLVDGRVLHFQDSGTDNVDKRRVTWPIVEALGLVVKEGTNAASKAAGL